MNNTNAAPLSQHRSLENWLSAYVSYTDDTEAPREFHLWSAISAVAGALGRKCWIDMGTFTLYPAFYIIFVAPARDCNQVDNCWSSNVFVKRI